MEVKTTEAAIITGLGQGLEVDTIELPERLHFGQVLVELYYSGICGSQIGEIDGVKGEDKWLPHLMGHEGSGRVLSIGEGVHTVSVGDHVVLHWRIGSGLQSETPRYSINGKDVNAGWVTTFNRHAVVSENRITVIPERFDLRFATLFGCAIPTGFGVACNDAKIKIGQSVVVFGAGGVGLNVIQASSMMSAFPVIAVDIRKKKLIMAKDFGADFTVDGTDRSLIRECVRSQAGIGGADVVVETTGRPDMIELAYELTAAKGRTILVGVPPAGKRACIYTLPLHFGKTLTGSHGGEAMPAQDIPRYIKLFEAGRMRLDGLITDSFSLQEINQAIDKVRMGDSGRVLIEFG